MRACRMPPPTKIAFALCWAVWPTAAQPVIADNGVTNAASYAVLRAPGAGIAPGSIFAVFGNGLGPDSALRATEYPLRTELAGTSVRFGEIPAYMLYASATQLVGIAPSTLRPGTHALTVTFNSRVSLASPVPVTQTDFGIFTRNSAGYGQAAAHTALPDGTMQILGLSTGARPGQHVVLYGTGLGPIAGAPDDRSPGAFRTEAPVEVIIDGRVLLADYAGRSPAFAGLDQINFKIPEDLPDNCYAAAGVRANGRLSNIVSVPIAQGGRSCAHPFGLSEDALRRMDSNRTVFAALALMERHTSSPRPSEGAGIGFAEMTPDDVEAFVSPSPDPYDGTGMPGTCVVLPSDQNRTVPIRPRASRPRYLDAGTLVRLTGPSFSAELPRVPGSGYGANLGGQPGQPENILQAGGWTYSGSGGANVGAFRFPVELPPPLTWTNLTWTTNRGERVIDPKEPLRIEWTGGGPELVRITGSAGTQGPEGLRFASFVCTARAQGGGFTIPSEMLAVLPAGGTGGLILTQRIAKTGFDVPLMRGGAVDGSQFRTEYQTVAAIQVLR